VVTVGTKSIFSAKSLFSETFNVNLKYLELSQEASVFLLILIQPIQNGKWKNPIFLFCVLKKHFTKFCRFSGTISVMAI
jgi:hypothetical protein